MSSLILHNSFNNDKGPTSFLVYGAKRRGDSDGDNISSGQLYEEWEALPEKEKKEYAAQSECIMLALDLQNRNDFAPLVHDTNRKKKHPRIPKIVAPPTSSMFIPMDNHSLDSQSRPFSHPLKQLPGLLSPSKHNGHVSPSSMSISSSIFNNKSSISSGCSIDQHHDSLTLNIPYPDDALESHSFDPFKRKDNLTNNIDSISTQRKYGSVPSRVKRPPNAYLLFNRFMRRQLQHVNRGLTSGEISKTISTKWKQLSPADREYYFQEENKLKEQHKNEYPNFIYSRRSKAQIKEAKDLKGLETNDYSGSLSVTLKKKPSAAVKNKPVTVNLAGGRDPRGRKKKKADATLPKHPMSAYLHYAKKMRPIMKKKSPEARLVEISRQIGEKWRSLSKTDLEPWVQIALEDKARYAQQMRDRVEKQQTEQQSDINDPDNHIYQQDNRTNRPVLPPAHSMRNSGLYGLLHNDHLGATKGLEYAALDTDAFASVAGMLNYRNK